MKLVLLSVHVKLHTVFYILAETVSHKKKINKYITCDVDATFAYASHTPQGRACALGSRPHGRAHSYATPRRPSTLYGTRKPQVFDADAGRARAEGLLLSGRMREDKSEQILHNKQ